VLFLPGWTNSKGACAEFDLARKLKIPIYYNINELESVC